MKKAIELLQLVAGPSYPVLFLKMGMEDWTPVGEECLYAVVPGKNDTAALVICDSDGNSKAMSNWVSAEEAKKFAAALEQSSVSIYSGEVKLPI